MIRKAFRPSIHIEHERERLGHRAESRAYLWATLEGKREDTIHCDLSENDLYELAEVALKVAGTLRRLRQEKSTL